MANDNRFQKQYGETRRERARRLQREAREREQKKAAEEKNLDLLGADSTRQSEFPTLTRDLLNRQRRANYEKQQISVQEEKARRKAETQGLDNISQSERDILYGNEKYVGNNLQSIETRKDYQEFVKNPRRRRWIATKTGGYWIYEGYNDQWFRSKGAADEHFGQKSPTDEAQEHWSQEKKDEFKTQKEILEKKRRESNQLERAKQIQREEKEAQARKLQQEQEQTDANEDRQRVDAIRQDVQGGTKLPPVSPQTDEEVMPIEDATEANFTEQVRKPMVSDQSKVYRKPEVSIPDSEYLGDPGYEERYRRKVQEITAAAETEYYNKKHESGSDISLKKLGINLEKTKVTNELVNKILKDHNSVKPLELQLLEEQLKDVETAKKERLETKEKNLAISNDISEAGRAAIRKEAMRSIKTREDEAADKELKRIQNKIRIYKENFKIKLQSRQTQLLRATTSREKEALRYKQSLEGISERIGNEINAMYPDVPVREDTLRTVANANKSGLIDSSEARDTAVFLTQADVQQMSMQDRILGVYQRTGADMAATASIIKDKAMVQRVLKMNGFIDRESEEDDYKYYARIIANPTSSSNVFKQSTQRFNMLFMNATPASRNKAKSILLRSLVNAGKSQTVIDRIMGSLDNQIQKDRYDNALKAAQDRVSIKQITEPEEETIKEPKSKVVSDAVIERMREDSLILTGAKKKRTGQALTDDEKNAIDLLPGDQQRYLNTTEGLNDLQKRIEELSLEEKTEPEEEPGFFTKIWNYLFSPADSSNEEETPAPQPETQPEQPVMQPAPQPQTGTDDQSVDSGMISDEDLDRTETRLINMTIKSFKNSDDPADKAAIDFYESAESDPDPNTGVVLSNFAGGDIEFGDKNYNEIIGLVTYKNLAPKWKKVIENKESFEALNEIFDQINDITRAREVNNY